jgi:hypothetical protein
MEIDHRISHKEIDVAADCVTCHPGHHAAMKNLVSGLGGKEAVSHPSRMFEIGLNCRGCHIFHKEDEKEGTEKTFVAKSSSCDKCHAEGYGKILSLWEESTGNKLGELNDILGTVKRQVEISIKKGVEMGEALKLVDAVEFNIDIVRKGRSLHNIKYANNLLSASYGMLKKVAAQIGRGYELPPFKHETGKKKTECLTCHYDIKQQSPSFSGLKFSHKNHLERDRVCLDCHSGSGKHGALAIEKSSCAACHHNDSVEKECGDCHTLQRDFFYGDWRGKRVVTRAAPNVMAEAIGCEECHGYADEVRRPDGESCVACHEEGYDAMMAEWQQDTRETLARITIMMDRLKVAANGAVDMKKVKAVEKRVNDIRNDGSLGVHNPIAVEEAAEEIEKELKRMIKGAGLSD